MLMRAIAFSIIVALVVIRPALLTASEDRPSSQPGARERLNQVLNPDGGIHVYKNYRGTAESTITLPNGERLITVQPPHGSGLNLGPPLQLNSRPLQLPPPPSILAQPPDPEFPQRAR